MMKKINGRIKLLVGIVIFFVIFVIVAVSISKRGTNKKIDFTNVISNQGKMPIINIAGLDVTRANEKIERIFDKYQKNNNIQYDYNITDDILSLIITVNTEDENGISITKFAGYNIDIKTGNNVSNKEILEKYQVTEHQVEKIIETTFRYYYKKETEAGMIPHQECNYECFLKWREVENYLDDIFYYIKDDSLTAYRGFYTTSIYGDDIYYSLGSHQFKIK